MRAKRPKRPAKTRTRTDRGGDVGESRPNRDRVAATKDSPRFENFRPSDFMRARRPELFSDSIINLEYPLRREEFDYHLETLTNRKQETEFEYFCRRLSERELCPNLLPQTGPTGGGDSKVDTETYPVADAISDLWYEGVAQKASTERWAFAFSAKKDWEPKLRSDVEKIVNTKRAYKLIYFITNQYVSDRKRAEAEDTLTRRSCVAVRVLDRNWIIERVFARRHFQLAIESLGLTGIAMKTQAVSGPRDTERETELRALEEEISDPARYQGVQYQLAEDCLRAAVLARGLEHPRTEIEGLFKRAERIAEKVGHEQQLLRIAYAKAWTAFWWHDDFDALNQLYDQVESLAAKSENASDLERLLNLWQLLVSTIRQDKFKASQVKLGARTKKLKVALNRLASEKERPNNALAARSNLLLLELTEAVQQKDDVRVNSTLQNLKTVLVDAEPLGTYPLEHFADLVRELGNIFAENVVYDELFENLLTLLGKRRSDGESGQVLIDRATQKLRAGKKYDAIRLFGRAQEKLVKREYRAELTTALMGCCLAYESTGLLWAARANAIAAVVQAFSEFWENGTVIRPALLALQKLVWLELQLGRIPSVLAWTQATDAIAAHLRLKDEKEAAFLEARRTQDLVLGILFLATPLVDLPQLDFLPHILEQLNLPYARMALLYALGYEGQLREEGWIPEEESEDSVKEFFWRWFNQPAKTDLLPYPDTTVSTKITLRSFVLGAEVIGTAANELPSIYFLEMLLGSIEAFLSTSLDADVIPHRETLRINLEPSKEVLEVPDFRVDVTSGEPTIEVRHSATAVPQTVPGTLALRDRLMEIIVHTLSHLVIWKDIDSYFQKLGGEERAFSRALLFSDVSTSITNILGATPKLRLSDWQAEFRGQNTPLKRSKPWNHGFQETKHPETDQLAAPKTPKFGKGKPPKDLFNMDELKHRDRRIFSLIDSSLWDKANWRGTVFMWPADIDTPPLLALAFENAEAAKSIFEGWRRRFGFFDERGELRIAIITGVDRKNPAAYRVHVGTDFKFSAEMSPGQQFVSVSRINSMEPRDLRNLEAFLERYRRAGKFGLAPAHLPYPTATPEVFLELAFGKKKLDVRSAWEIGENDFDMVAIEPDDDPIIPAGVRDPPIVQTLKRVRERPRMSGLRGSRRNV
jgi:hypothetical protein